MSDLPLDDHPNENAAAENDPLSDGWRTPEDDALNANEEPGWHQPAEDDDEGAGWHTPDATTDAGTKVLPAGMDDSTALPGSWHVPPPEVDATASYYEEKEGGWFVPESSARAALLQGVDDTLHFQSDPAPEPVPVDEETIMMGEPLLVDDHPVEEPVLTQEPLLVDDRDDPLLVDDSLLDDSIEGVYEEILDAPTVKDEAVTPPDVEDAAAIAARMAAQLTSDQPPAHASEMFPPATGASVAETPAAQPTTVEPAAEVPDIGLPEAEPVLGPEVTAGYMRLVEQFDNVEQQVATLRGMYNAGQISREQLQDQLRKLMILDEQGAWWMIGMESNTWYHFVDNAWLESDRPQLSAVDAAPAAPEPSQSIVLDEYNMPVAQHVPVRDPQATMVGSSATEFDQISGYDQQQPYAERVQQEPYDPYAEAQPDYGSAYASAEEDALYRQVRDEESRQRRGTFAKIAASILFIGLGLIFVGIVGIILYYVITVNRYDAQINNLQNLAGGFETTRIYDANGNLIARLNDPNGGNRISVPLDQINPNTIHAVISIEDERFYENPGWDPIAIGRAFIQNLTAGEIVSGASTITVQLAKMLVIEPERATEISYWRKIDEAIIAAEIGRRYEKNAILELYLNEVYFGNLAYGVEAGSQTYHQHPASDNNLPQSAMMAGLIACPATCDPITSRETAMDRMAAVLAKQAEVGCLPFQHEPYVSTGEQFCVSSAVDPVEQALVEVADYYRPNTLTQYPHFVLYVQQELERTYGMSDVYRRGYNVYTTLDASLQQEAEAAVRDQIAQLNAQGRGGNNGSVVVMDPRDGRLMALVGSADFNNEEIDGEVNVAFTPQQPGSSIKPLVYTAALQGNANGEYFTPATVLWDTSTCWGGYCPSNYDLTYHGPQSVRAALANSYNIPAVKALDFVGTQRFMETALAMGLTFPGSNPVESGLPSALGAVDVYLWDMTVAFGTLANGGRLSEPYSIVRIVDNEGNEIPPPDRPEAQQVIQPEHAYLITHILSDDVARSTTFGSNSALAVSGYQVAAKTGTTNDNRDNWTMGYAPNVVVGVWHGNTDNTPMTGTSGFIGAAPIWNRVMRSALSREAPQQFPPPSGVGTITVCADSGTVPSEYCLNRRQELAAAAQPPPSAEFDIYEPKEIDTLTGLVANEFCTGFTETEMFLDIADPTAFAWINDTALGQQWAAQRNVELPARQVPTQGCNANVQAPIIGIDYPQPNTEVQGLVEVQGRVLVYNFHHYQLEYGIGNNPDTWEIANGPYQISHPNTELIGIWDVSQLPAGPYTLRLAVFTNDGGYAYLDNVVMVNNPLATPTVLPTVAIITQTPFVPTVEFPTLAPPGQVTATPFIPTVTTSLPTAPGQVTSPPPAATGMPPRDPNLDIPIAYGAQATGFINNNSVVTYYRFDGQAGDLIEFSSEATTGNLDTLLYLMDAGNNILSEDDDGGTGTNSLLSYTLPAPGTYVIAVTRFDVSAGLTNGEYRMTLTKLN